MTHTDTTNTPAPDAMPELKFYFVVHCDDCEPGYGCNEFSWVKNSQEDGELYATEEEAEEAANQYIDGSPWSFKVNEVEDGK